MAVGYLPDTFGHIAQMPQLLARAGLDHAVVWRGVPGAVDRTGFWWEAPDGTDGAGRVPADRLRQRRPHAGRPESRSSPGSTRGSSSSGTSSATTRSC